MMRPVVATVEFAVRRPWLVLALATLLTIAGLWLSITRFALDTDTARLISPDIDWRRSEIAFAAAFPGQSDVIVVVIDATTPEAAEIAADSLVEDLHGRMSLFRRVERPDGGPFFARNGLLYLPQEELAAALDAIVGQEGLLEPLARDRSLRGFGQLVETALSGIAFGAVKLDDLAPAFDAFADSLERVLSGDRARLSWRKLLANPAAAGRDNRRLVLAEPVLDFSALEPGAASVDAVRDALRRNGLDAAHGIRARLTGSVPLADEEFATIAENAGLNFSLTILAVAAILWAALRSPKLIGAVLVALFVGLVLTSGLGLLVVGRLNLISVAFAVLFIGLGVDFGIQFSVRYRAERHAGDDIAMALTAAAGGVGFSLTLAAISLAVGFLSFLPTKFQGVSELGLIAGLGMVIAFVVSVTLLPALITLVKPAPERASLDTRSLAAIDHWIARHRVLVLVVTAIVVLAGLPALLRLRFDSDPMNLRSRQVESVATYLDLARDPLTSPDMVDVLAPSEAAVPALEAKLSALPEVARAISLGSFIPDDQPAKLALISAAAGKLAPLLHPPNPAAALADGERVSALRKTATALASTSDEEGDAGSPGRVAASRLAAVLVRLADGAAGLRSRAEDAVTANFTYLLDGLEKALGASPVTRQNLPPDKIESWVAKDGHARISIFPRALTGDKAASERFVAAVQSVAPEVTGAPVTIARSGETIVGAFIEAGSLALAAITLILWVALRRLWDVVLALAPLVLAGVLTLEFAQIIGLSLNFANIIALPLMFGVGVAFHIYYLIAWRAGLVDVLASSLTRAIFFSALTTGVAFGSLWASSHPGTASMGELLAISLVFTLVAAFIIVPAVLGPPRPPDPTILKP